MSGITTITRGASGESRKILKFSDLPDAVKDRVLGAAFAVAIYFGNAEISECEAHVELALEELESAVHEMERYAQAAGPRACS